ncbi:exodeoxyribonuclease III [Chitinophagales bacterium]|nr:exodeoxyribonuclease III [Chitinophagales bacterium]
MTSIKIATYNVNGIRAAAKKGLYDWFEQEQYDVICLQETKAQEEQIDIAGLEELGYHCNWYSAQKKGYSGVGILSKMKPTNVVKGMGNDKYDSEGRILRADFGDWSIISAYFPSGSSGELRQQYKFEFLDDFSVYIKELIKERPKLIVSGDYNVCHLDIDIHNPSKQHKTSGFLPEERAWLDNYFENDFIDVFREFNSDPHHYSWWSYRAGARGNNKGWRIDYNAATLPLKKHLRSSAIRPDAVHSDHCPVEMSLEI